MKRFLIKNLVLSLTSICLPSLALAWGTYGHEQISSAAIQLLSDSPHGNCLKKNSAFLIRMVVAPDLDWKGPKTKPLEGPLHFFEPDGAEGQQGGAIQRIRQLFDLSRNAIRNKNRGDAYFYMGALAHYVGDLSQPFHSTVNYDGQFYPSALSPDHRARGVHSAFEEGIFEEWIFDHFRSTRFNHETNLWSSFSPTETEVLKFAQENHGNEKMYLEPTELEGEISKMTEPNVALVNPLLQIYLKWKSEVAPSMPSFKQKYWVNRQFYETQIGSQTVLSLAEERLAAAAVLVARIWATILQDSGDEGGCPSLQFDRDAVLARYPVLNLLEDVRQELERPQLGGSNCK